METIILQPNAIQTAYQPLSFVEEHLGETEQAIMKMDEHVFPAALAANKVIQGRKLVTRMLGCFVRLLGK